MQNTHTNSLHTFHIQIVIHIAGTMHSIRYSLLRYNYSRLINYANSFFYEIKNSAPNVIMHFRGHRDANCLVKIIGQRSIIYRRLYGKDFKESHHTKDERALIARSN